MTKHLSKEFQRSIYWNKYNSHVLAQNAGNNYSIRIKLDSDLQGVKRLFVPAFLNDVDGDANKVERNNYKKYFLARVGKETAKVL